LVKDVNRTGKPAPGPLVTHGLESLSSAVELLGHPSPTDRSTRQAIVFLAIGSELLLKSRLLDEHWSLVFDKIEAANIQDLEDGEFKSVSPEQCIQRLAGSCQVKLRPRAEEAFKSLWKYRNKVVHFAVRTPPDSIRARAFAVLSELADFISAECTLLESDVALMRSVTAGLASMKEYVTKRTMAIKAELGALQDGGYYCPSCGQRAVDLADSLRCLFCHEEDQYPGEVWDAHVKALFGGLQHLDQNVASCHTCQTPYVVSVEPGKPEMRCLYCGLAAKQDELRQCPSCRSWVTAPAAGEQFTCPDCPGLRLTVV
jgi:hypothetical protein